MAITSFGSGVLAFFLRRLELGLLLRLPGETIRAMYIILSLQDGFTSPLYVLLEQSLPTGRY
jgi:hypothetical protein